MTMWDLNAYTAARVPAIVGKIIAGNHEGLLVEFVLSISQLY